MTIDAVKAVAIIAAAFVVITKPYVNMTYKILHCARRCMN